MALSVGECEELDAVRRTASGKGDAGARDKATCRVASKPSSGFVIGLDLCAASLFTLYLA